MKNAETSLWLAQAVLVLAAGASWSDARAYGNATDGNCGFFILQCAFVVPQGSTFSNAAGITLAPDSLSYSNFTNLGIFNNSGYVWNAGLFDNVGFYNGPGAHFNNLGSASKLEQTQGSNLGTISNEGTFRINFLQGGSYPILGGLFNGVNGVIDNKRSLVNRGQLGNAGSITNFAGATMVSSYNPGPDPNHPEPPYDVAIDNNALAVLSNRGFFRNGSNSILHNSTITNSGLLENIGGGPGVNDGQFDNFDTIKNSGSGTIKNTGTLTNNYQLINTVAAALYNNKDLINNGTLDNSSNAPYPPQPGAVVVGYGLVNGTNGVLTNNAQLSNSGTLTNIGILQNAGTLTNSGTITNNGTINNSGIFNISAGGSVTGSGTFTQSVGTTQVDGNMSQPSVVINGGDFNLTGSLTAAVSIKPGVYFHINGSNTTVTVTGAIDNLGFIKVDGNGAGNPLGTNGLRVTYSGHFSGNGGYQSDPATNVFAGGLTVGPTGYLVGGAEDEFVMQGDFFNSSTQNALWNTELSKIIFEGGSTHHVNFGSADNGAGGFTDNFAWGSLSIDAADSLDVSGNVYARLLSLSSIGQLTGGGTIYYDPTLAGNAYLGGASYDLDGGGHLLALAAVPEPESYVLMLAGLCLVGGICRRAARTASAAVGNTASHAT